MNINYSICKQLVSNPCGYALITCSRKVMSLSLSNYFTHLKGCLSEELENFRPIPSCSCEIPYFVISFQQLENRDNDHIN